MKFNTASQLDVVLHRFGMLENYSAIHSSQIMVIGGRAAHQ
jgi:hypothetical protein